MCKCGNEQIGKLLQAYLLIPAFVYFLILTFTTSPARRESKSLLLGAPNNTRHRAGPQQSQRAHQ